MANRDAWVNNATRSTCVRVVHPRVPRVLVARPTPRSCQVEAESAAGYLLRSNSRQAIAATMITAMAAITNWGAVK